MSSCLFCNKIDGNEEVPKHKHSICISCKIGGKPKLDNDYCRDCFQKYLVKKRNCPSNCRQHINEQAYVVDSCKAHSYCNKELISEKAHNCKICICTLSKFCCICFEFKNEYEIKHLHGFHSFCNTCINNTKELECKKCELKGQPNYIELPSVSDNNYIGKKTKKANKTNHISKIKKSNDAGKSPKKYPKHNLSVTETTKDNCLHQNSSMIINNCFLQHNPQNYQSVTCEKHNMQCYSTLNCRLHIYCDMCIFYYILLKFNRFIKAIKMLDLKWLNKLHKYGCYNPNCSFADFSYTIYSFRPYLENYIGSKYSEFLPLLNYFIPFIEGFDFKFHLCYICKTNIIEQSYTVCGNCYQAQISYGAITS